MVSMLCVVNWITYLFPLKYYWNIRVTFDRVHLKIKRSRSIYLIETVLGEFRAKLRQGAPGYLALLY